MKRTVNESPTVWITHETVLKWQTNGWEPFRWILLPVGNCPFVTRAQGTYERTSRKTDWSRTGRDPHGFRTCTNARKRTTTVRFLNYDTLSWNSSLLMYLQELWTCSKLSVEWMNFISLPINWTYLKNKKRTENKCKRRYAFRKCCHLFDELLSMRCN